MFFSFKIEFLANWGSCQIMTMERDFLIRTLSGTELRSPLSLFLKYEEHIVKKNVFGVNIEEVERAI